MHGKGSTRLSLVFDVVVVGGWACLTEFALHLSRRHQRPIKYFMSTAFFELAWEG